MHLNEGRTRSKHHLVIYKIGELCGDLRAQSLNILLFLKVFEGKDAGGYEHPEHGGFRQESKMKQEG